MAATTKSRSRYARLYAVAGQLGMDDADLKAFILAETGKESKTLLDDDDLEAACRELDRRLGTGRITYPTAPRQKFQFTEKPGGMSTGQYRKVLALMCELRKFDPVPSEATIEQRVTGIIKKYLHMTVSPDNPYFWLSCKQSVTLIRCIESILKNERQKTEARRESG